MIWIPAAILTLFVTSTTGAAAVEPRFDTLRAVYGKSFLSKEVRVITRLLKDKPTFASDQLSEVFKDDGQDDVGFYLHWKAKGLELRVEHGKVEGITIFNKDAEGYARYEGELPHQLTLRDGLTAIEKKVGKADQVTRFERSVPKGEKPADEIWLDYPKKGIRVTLHHARGDSEIIHLGPPLTGQRGGRIDPCGTGPLRCIDYRPASVRHGMKYTSNS